MSPLKKRLIRRNVLLTAGSAIMLLSMIGLFAGVSFVILGSFWLIPSAGLLVLIVLTNPYFAHRLRLGIKGAREITFANAPLLAETFERLVARAGLAARPSLYYVESDTMNALGTGTASHPSVVLSSALLQGLSIDELEGVMAHEISHIKNNDLFLLSIGNSIRAVVQALAWFGGIVLFFSIPYLTMQRNGGLLIAALVLIAAPFASYLLWLKLSRTRELAADAGSVALTGNPESFRNALVKIGGRERRMLAFFGIGEDELKRRSIFHTHPVTEERIRELDKLCASTNSAFRDRDDSIPWHRAS